MESLRPEGVPAPDAAPQSPPVTPATAPVGPPGPAASMPRSLAPDIARGMMLLLIAFANSTWYLFGHPSDGANVHPTDGSPLDTALQAVMIVTIDARIYPMFAFLFGYGMVQFFRSRALRGVPEPQIRRMLRRRHWALLLFGLVHAALLFVGDILGAYGLAGLVLVALFFRRRDKVLKVWIGVLLGLLVAGMLLSSWSAWYLANHEVPGATAGNQYSMEWMRDLVSAQPNYLVSVAYRLGGWAFMTPTMGLLSLTIPTAILLGWLYARRGLLEEPWRHRPTLVRMAALGIPVAWLGGLPGALHHVGVLKLPEQVPWAFSMLDTVTGLAGGVGYVAVFALLAIKWTESRGPAVNAIAAVGKRSLSFYLLQSLVFAPLLSAWGLGLGGRINTAAVLAIATAIWVASLLLGSWLERTGRRGPFEIVLRRLTYGRS